jgi:hypothetical protein
MADDEMWVAEFHGVVHPQGGGWSLQTPVDLNFDDGHWTVVIVNSTFRVVVHGTRPEDVETFKNDVLSIVQGILDSVGFHLGAALSAELTGGFVAPNVLIQRTLTWPEAANRSPDAPPWVDAKTLAPFVNASTIEPQLRRALADLNLALARPDDTAFYAYRAVECVRQYFAQRDGLTEKKDLVKSWQVLRDTLGFTEEELTELGKTATTPRHGGLTPISATERLAAILLARRVVSAFVDYLNSESTPGTG